MHKRSPKAFTVIELLVVVAIIALLVGILLPAIGHAREQAQLTRSQSNLKNMAAACAAYSAEWKDRQITWINDYLSRYGSGPGTDATAAFANFAQVNGYIHPWFILGYGQGAIWVFIQNYRYLPIDWTQKFGAFRYPNGHSFTQYLNGRFYDEILYAPKDTEVWASVEGFFEKADEFTPSGVAGTPQRPSSYCFSPAAMFDPSVLSYNKSTGTYFTDAWNLPSGFRSPSPSQALYSDLKSNMIEHHWLQNRKKHCITSLLNGVYDGCQPYFFNGSVESSPVTLFYDGHVGTIGQREAVEADFRAFQQGAGGLYSIDTPLGGCRGDAPNCNAGGYFMEYGLDWTNTSYHILTINGIKGRDILAH
jgi:prepilin-type N-terminal cleavage/methylation domain-containing protein